MGVDANDDQLEITRITRSPTVQDSLVTHCRHFFETFMKSAIMRRQSSRRCSGRLGAQTGRTTQARTMMAKRPTRPRCNWRVARTAKKMTNVSGKLSNASQATRDELVHDRPTIDEPPRIFSAGRTAEHSSRNVLLSPVASWRVFSRRLDGLQQLAAKNPKGDRGSVSSLTPKCRLLVDTLPLFRDKGSGALSSQPLQPTQPSARPRLK